MVYNDGSFFNEECEIIAVRIRTVSVHRMWPNIPRTTLLFSSKEKYHTIDALDNRDDYHKFHKAIKPKYG